MSERSERRRRFRDDFAQIRGEEEYRENRRVRHEVKAALATVHDLDAALDVEALPLVRHVEHDHGAESVPVRDSRWRSRHWRQKMWKRRRSWKETQSREAARFWLQSGGAAQ